MGNFQLFCNINMLRTLFLAYAARGTVCEASLFVALVNI
jgi:hypothetical protein